MTALARFLSFYAALFAAFGVASPFLPALFFPAMALVEPLHGLTFALVHLTCMDVIRRIVPQSLAATAQAVYATVAMGVAGAAVTLASGPLYQRLGAGSFWFMAGLCAVALPASAWLRVSLHGSSEPTAAARTERPEPKRSTEVAVTYFDRPYSQLMPGWNIEHAGEPRIHH